MSAQDQSLYLRPHHEQLQMVPEKRTSKEKVEWLSTNTENRLAGTMYVCMFAQRNTAILISSNFLTDFHIFTGDTSQKRQPLLYGPGMQGLIASKELCDAFLN